MHPGPPLRVGFGSLVPPHCGTKRVERESFHERKAYQEFKAIHERRAAEADRVANFPPNTHGYPKPPFPESLPPPPGWKVKAKSTEQAVKPSSQGDLRESCLYALRALL
jgi:hypothetical protein